MTDENEFNQRRHSVLYTLIEGDIWIDADGNHQVTDGEVWIYSNGSIRSRDAITRTLTDGAEIISYVKRGNQVINLETLEPI